VLANAHESAAVWNVSPTAVALPDHPAALDDDGYGHGRPALDARVGAWAARHRVIVGRWAGASPAPSMGGSYLS
jgi:hypothetical protein